MKLWWQYWKKGFDGSGTLEGIFTTRNGRLCEGDALTSSIYLFFCSGRGFKVYADPISVGRLYTAQDVGRVGAASELGAAYPPPLRWSSWDVVCVRKVWMPIVLHKNVFIAQNQRIPQGVSPVQGEGVGYKMPSMGRYTLSRGGVDGVHTPSLDHGN